MKDLNLIVGLGLALALTGCPGDDSGDEGADSTSASTSTTANDVTTEDPPGTDSTTDDPPGTDSTTSEPGTDSTTAGDTDDTTAGTTGGTTMGVALSFDLDVWPIIEANCLGLPGTCHDPGAGGLQMLDSMGAYGNLVDVPSSQSGLDRVEPGIPMDSYLFRKVSGTHVEAGGLGGQMPLGQAPLDGATIAIIEQWISDGAEP